MTNYNHVYRTQDEKLDYTRNFISQRLTMYLSGVGKHCTTEAEREADLAMNHVELTLQFARGLIEGLADD